MTVPGLIKIMIAEFVILFSLFLYLSLSPPFPSSFSLSFTVKAAVNSGVPFVVAAGNESQDACNRSPASEPTAITVMCSDNTDKFCYFSNYGRCADIIAPGMSITSTWIKGPSSDNTISGTSMSSPHVAGVVAKMISSSSSTLTPEQVYIYIYYTRTYIYLYIFICVCMYVYVTSFLVNYDLTVLLFHPRFVRL